MKQGVVRIFIIMLLLGLGLAVNYQPRVSSSDKKADSNQIASESDNFDYNSGNLDRENAKRMKSYLKKADKGRKWLLEPSFFNYLSSSGQAAALLVNGKLETPKTPLPGDEPERILPALAAPGYNLRINFPVLDRFGQSQSQSTIGINGSNIVVSYNDTGNLSVLFGDINLASYSVSANGGTTFSQKRIPPPFRGFNLGNGVVTAGLNSEFYFANLAFDQNFNSIISVAKSTDGGQNFAQIADASTTAVNSSDLQDKCWITVDRSANSPFRGSVYVTWTVVSQEQGAIFINFTRSTNGGRSFEPPVAISTKEAFSQGAIPAVAPNGDIYVAYENIGLGEISMVKSTDGGRTFNKQTTIARFNSLSFTEVTGGNNVRVFSFPQMTVDNRGFVHIVFAATTSLFSPDRSDIYYIRSTDGGINFSEPRKVNDDNTKTTQANPSIAAAADGSIAVKWLDRRNDPINDGLNDVFMAISKDGGVSFGKNFFVTDTNWVFNTKEATLGQGYHSDYDGMASDGDDFYLSWSDERGGDPDIFFARVPIGQNDQSPDFSISAMKLFDSVIGGGSVDFDLKTLGFNGFSKSLSLNAAFPAINGMSCKFVNSKLTAGESTRMTISTTPTTRPGTYIITVTANDTEKARSTNLRLTIYGPSRPAGSLVNVSNTAGFSRTSAGFQLGPDGTIHLLFEDDTQVAGGGQGSEIFYAQSLDNGKTFSKPIKISAGSQVSNSSKLAVDPKGNIYAVWTDQNSSRTISTIIFSRSTDGGKSFSNPSVLSTISQNAFVPNIATDKKGNILVTYSAVTTRPVLQLFALRSINGGQSFTTPVQISLDNESVQSSHAVFDSNGAAYVVYNDVRLVDEGLVATINMAVAQNGADFKNRGVISGVLLRKAFLPFIAIDNNDNLFVAWGQGLEPGLEIILIKSTDKGNTFGPQVNVSKTVRNSRFPFVVPDNAGNVVVMWDDSSLDRNFNPEIMLARSTNGGTSFTPPINVSVNPGISIRPAGAFNSNGELILSWADDSSADPDIFVTSVSFPKSQVPLITGFNQSVIAIGSELIISGSNFQQALELRFPNSITLPPTVFKVSSDGSQITTRVPANTVSGLIAVRTPFGIAVSSEELTIVPADFTISANPASQTIAAGASTSFTLGIQAVGFNEPVSLSVISPVSTITASLSEATINTTTRSTLTINTTPDTPPNFVYNIVITGKAGDLARTSTVTVNIVSADFSLVVPSQLSVKKGTEIQFNAEIKRTGNFSGNVSVTAPDTKGRKLVISIAQPSTTGTSVGIKIKAKKTAKTGPQQLIFSAKDDTGRIRTGVLTLNIE
jgi:hypothetical protein